ncbi:hypothetical protein BOTBODRAFT_52133 [Botryobasidium botryosum FD-172 SS1]|uniref:RA-domain-containing protein n=1 Tax=Botryobasidium botryosum (strain FD-172 SS1) TaxID=930990 RepID=A0A067MT73_BOTB1|nr:hypothetical protein BOTBODRAFT_52133 [Botryobasidium botryosum FD-172 SS1]
MPSPTTADITSVSLLDWDEDSVNSWLTALGYGRYQIQILEHGISGDVLSVLDHEGLKEIGVSSVGQRLAILREVYLLKRAQNIPIEPEHYVPPSEAVNDESQTEDHTVTLERIVGMIQEQNEKIRILEEENRRLDANFQAYIEDHSSTRPSRPTQMERTLEKQPSFKWATYSKPVPSPTLPTPDPPSSESPRVSPHRLEHDPDLVHTAPPHKYVHQQSPAEPPPPPPSDRPANPPSRPTTSRSASNGTPGSSSGTKEKRDGGAENHFKSFKVSLDDPCWKVLPAALKKYKISDDWQHYAMFICYGTTERCLSYDEKPLLLFQKLKDANKNPVFMLRHIKDIRSPIIVAQQKQVARLGLNENGTPGGASGNGSGSGNGPASAGAGAASSLSAIPAFSRNSKLSHPHAPHGTSKPGANGNGNGNGNGGSSSAQSQWPEDGENGGRVRTHHHAPGEEAHAEGGTAYAVAIYPYLAEQWDELDVVVDDTFIILARTKGWWEVQRDVAGTGESAESNRKGWVPAGCLLETTMPPGCAVAETRAANASNGHNRGRRPDSPPTRTQVAQNAPILPAKITSTSFPGIALMKYVPKGDHELELTENDLLRVFKRYNHWSYAIKEETGDRGWVPSWYIGKAGNGSNATVPSSSQGATGAGTCSGAAGGGPSAEHDDGTHERLLSSQTHNASPMSPAFLSAGHLGGIISTSTLI